MRSGLSKNLTGAFHPLTLLFVTIIGRRSMKKKKPILTLDQQKRVREAIRVTKIKGTLTGDKPPVTLPKLKFMEKKDDSFT